MDAIKYLKLKKKMGNDCSVDSNCYDCALNDNPYNMDCSTFELEHPREAVAAVEKWEKEHMNNRMNKLLKYFPEAKKSKNEEFLDICPEGFGEECEGGIFRSVDTCNDCKRKYWTEEIGKE